MGFLSWRCSQKLDNVFKTTWWFIYFEFVFQSVYNHANDNYNRKKKQKSQNKPGQEYIQLGPSNKTTSDPNQTQKADQAKIIIGIQTVQSLQIIPHSIQISGFVRIFSFNDYSFLS